MVDDDYICRTAICGKIKKNLQMKYSFSLKEFNGNEYSMRP